MSGHLRSTTGIVQSMSDPGARVTKVGLLHAVRRTWWVVPLAIVICTGLLYAQDSGLSPEPAQVQTIRRYEAVEALSALSALNVDPQAFTSVLTSAGEMARFNSLDRQAERNEENGLGVRMQISQAPGDFAVVNKEISDRNTFYSIVEVTSSLFAITCTEANAKDCARALDLGKSEFETGRNAAIKSGISAVADVLQLRLDAVRRMIESSNDPTALAVQRQLEAELASQVDVLRASDDVSAFELVFIDEAIEARAATIDSVPASTYGLGVILGLVIGGLIILQFAVLRSRRP